MNTPIDTILNPRISNWGTTLLMDLPHKLRSVNGVVAAQQDRSGKAHRTTVAQQPLFTIHSPPEDP